MTKLRLFLKRASGPLGVLFFMLIGLAGSAQTSTLGFPLESSCTSKDLELRDVFLKPVVPCDYTGPQVVWLSVFNKTGSTRTSFAAWGDLYINDVRYGQVFTGCVGPVAPNSLTSMPSKTPFAFPAINAGDVVELRNVYLAWTTANTAQTCEVVLANPGGIAPKCGTLPTIPVRTGMTIKVDYADLKCAGTDKTATVKVKVSGGTPNYTVTVRGVTKTATADNQELLFPEVLAGATTISVADNDPAKTGGCTASKSITVPSAPDVTAHSVTGFTRTCDLNTSPTNIGSAGNTTLYSYLWTSPANGVLSSTTDPNPTASPIIAGTYTYTVTKTDKSSNCKAGPTSVTVIVNNKKPVFSVALTQPTFCSKGAATIATCNTDASATYAYSINGGTGYQASGSFTNLGSSDISSILVKNNANGCVSDAVDCSKLSGTGLSCPQEVGQAPVANQEVSAPVMAASKSAPLTVKAFPNPFSSKVSFNVTSPVSGNGSIELFNMQGQKLATVYKGRINAGSSNYQYYISKTSSAALVYVLQVEGKTVTGKLMNAAR